MSSGTAKKSKEKGSSLKVVHKDPALQKMSAWLKYFKSDVVLIASAKAGISPDAISDLMQISGKPLDELASLIYFTPRTIRNYVNGNKALPLPQSEQVLKLYALYSRGIETFGDTDTFNRWMSKTSLRLNNDTPQSMLLTSTGTKLVMDELTRIMNGDLF